MLSIVWVACDRLRDSAEACDIIAAAVVVGRLRLRLRCVRLIPVCVTVSRRIIVCFDDWSFVLILVVELIFVKLRIAFRWNVCFRRPDMM